MEFGQTSIPDVIVLQPEIFGDERGFFMETFRANDFAASGIAGPFVQDNHSGSQQGILRGLHYQIRHPQGKLVRVVTGEIFDAAVDIRRSSLTFGKSIGMLLSAQNKRQLWLPPGFAHGFYVLSDWAEVLYKATEYYDPEAERVIIWNDPTIKVAWPIATGKSPTISRKDIAGKFLSEAEIFE
jgi:dTDP-4-dehydrorhamnose 3,5-epimerase